MNQVALEGEKIKIKPKLVWMTAPTDSSKSISSSSGTKSEIKKASIKPVQVLSRKSSMENELAANLKKMLKIS